MTTRPRQGEEMSGNSVAHVVFKYPAGLSEGVGPSGRFAEKYEVQSIGENMLPLWIYRLLGIAPAPSQPKP